MPPISEAPYEFTRRIRSPASAALFKANELKIYAFFLSVVLFPAASDQVQDRLNKERQSQSKELKASEIYVKICNLILLCAAFNILGKRVTIV